MLVIVASFISEFYSHYSSFSTEKVDSTCGLTLQTGLVAGNDSPLMRVKGSHRYSIHTYRVSMVKWGALTLGTTRVTGSGDSFRLGMPLAKWLLCWGLPLTISRVAWVIIWYTGINWEMGTLNTNEVKLWLCVWSREIYVKIPLI